MFLSNFPGTLSYSEEHAIHMKSISFYLKINQLMMLFDSQQNINELNKNTTEILDKQSIIPSSRQINYSSSFPPMYVTESLSYCYVVLHGKHNII